MANGQFFNLDRILIVLALAGGVGGSVSGLLAGQDQAQATALGARTDALERRMDELFDAHRHHLEGHAPNTERRLEALRERIRSLEGEIAEHRGSHHDGP